MSIIKTVNSTRFIPVEYFWTCKIDKSSKKEIRSRYDKSLITQNRLCYFLQKFEFHIKQIANISLQEYCEKYLNVDWPLCPITKTKVRYHIRSDGLYLNFYNSHHITRNISPKLDAAYKRFSIERKGSGNPMFGKKAWNSGLSIEDERIRLIAQKRTGQKMAEESKEKMRLARKNSSIKSRHNIPHSKETVEKMKIHTAKLWASGVFNRTTSIHIKMREFLQNLNLKEKFQEEYQVKYFSLDFAFPLHKIGIECQGTYFHIDPRIYPNGPKDAIQRRNFGRDKAKRKYLGYIGWIIIECWETEINDGNFKEFLIKKLKELDLINE